MRDGVYQRGEGELDPHGDRKGILWAAYIVLGGRETFLGVYGTPEDAERARELDRRQFGGDR